MDVHIIATIKVYSFLVIKEVGDGLYRLILQRLASIVGILLVVTIGTFVLIDPVFNAGNHIVIGGLA